MNTVLTFRARIVEAELPRELHKAEVFHLVF